MYLFLQHELDVSVHSFNSSTPLISVVQDHIHTPIPLRSREKTARDYFILIILFLLFLLFYSYFSRRKE